MKRYLLIALLGLFVASPVWGQTAWTAAYEAIPADGELVSLGDDRIRDFKSSIRVQMTTEHDTSNIGGLTDSGRHHEGAARAFVQAAEPAAIVHIDVLPGGPSTDLDDGRIFIDEDDSQPFFRDESAATDIAANYGGAAADWISLWPRTLSTVATATAANQTAGVVDTREIITGMSVAVVTPDDGRAYEIVVNANVHYALDNGNQMGFWLVEDTGPTDEDEAVVYQGGGTEVGALSLSFVQVAPVAGTTYTYTVEFASNPIATSYANPNAANAVWAVGGAAAGDFVGTTSMSRITAELRPRYTTATY